MIIKKTLKKNRIIQQIILLKNRWINKRTQINLAKNGKQVLALSVDILDSCNVNYWLDYGTLLGAIRNNDFIKGDGDIDLGIDIEEDISSVIHSFIEKGFKVYCYYHVDPDSLGRIVSLKKKGIIVDLYNYTISDSAMWCTIYEQDGCDSIEEYYSIHDTLKVYYLCYDFKIETMFYNFFDIRVKIPKNFKEYLTTIYGSDYMVEKSKWDGSLNKKNMPGLKAKIKL